VGVGYGCGSSMTSGSANAFFGFAVATANTGGSNNTYIGERVSGDGNAVGTGSNNVGVGKRALYSQTSGYTNTAVGVDAGNSLTTGSNNTIIGYDADATSATVNNEITLGNSSISSLRCATQSISALSDARDKTNIASLQAGLNFVEHLNPVSFTWNMRDGGKVGIEDTGFIAQDLQQVQQDTGVNIPGLVYDENPEKLEASYGRLIPVLVQAIKDLSAKVNELEAQIN